MQRIVLLLLLSTAVLAQTSASFASGGYSGGGFNNGNTRAPQVQRRVDQSYEIGKAIFKGRAKGEPSLKYCIAVEGEKIPVKRKSVKAYKKNTFNNFAANLFRCDQPDSLVAESLSPDSLSYVVYYLNKRHKLKLR